MEICADRVKRHNEEYLPHTSCSDNCNWLTMEFKDWRKSPDKMIDEQEAPKIRKYRGKQYLDYIDEQIQEAQARGEFDNLPGFGKPLNLDDSMFTGDKALAYSLLKQNGFSPPEIELAKEIRSQFEKAQAKLEKLRHQRNSLRTRRVPPFDSEKRAFNHAVEKATTGYDQLLHELNRKILKLNLITPSSMHMSMFEVEKLVQQFRVSCPLFD
jgi:DnaJ family protein C protein 28